MKKTVINISAQDFCNVRVYFFSINTECDCCLYDKCGFNFIRNCPSVFKNGYTILHTHEQSVRVQFAPQLRQRLVLSFFFFKFILAVLVSV